MKHFAIILLSTALLAGCSDSDTPPPTTALTVPIPADSPLNYPTLKIDAEHDTTGTNPPPAYQINATSGVWLDGSHYHFTYGTNDIAPNMVHIIVGNAIYKLYWPVPTNIYIISPVTLDAIKGEAFSGFRSGDHVEVVIGRAKDTSSTDQLWVSWAGQIEVK